MEEADTGLLMTMIGVSGWMFLLVPAYRGCPRQNPESHEMVAVVVVVTAAGNIGVVHGLLLKEISNNNYLFIAVKLFEVIETQRTLYLVLEHASGGMSSVCELTVITVAGSLAVDTQQVLFVPIQSTLDTALCTK